jgi:class 3 adenylate cyclase
MIQTRRLAAILAADVAGYSRLMGADQEVNPVVKDNSGTHHGSS